MESGLGRILLSFGAIFIGFGITFLIIEALAYAFGTPRQLGMMLGIAGLVIGGILAGAGLAMNKSRSARPADR